MGIKDRFTKEKLSEFLRTEKTHFISILKKTGGSIKSVVPATGNFLKKAGANLKETRFWTKDFWVQNYNKIRSRLPSNLEDVRKLQPEELAEALLGKDGYSRAKELFSGKAYGTYSRMAFIAFASYFLADTVSMFTDSLVPEPPVVPAPRITKKGDKQRNILEYSAITDRNIFSSKNIIPEEDGMGSGPARKTNLPLTLIGTVVLADEMKSIATIEDKSANMIFPLRVDDNIDGKIKVTKIERFKVYFINQGSGSLEYVEIIEDLPQLNVSAPIKQSSFKPTGTQGIVQTSDNKFEIEKSLIDKSLTNITQILQQARAIPNFENGMPDGFKLVQIEKGSVFESLGLKDNDVLCGINGESLNDPGKAFQLFNEIRNVTHLELCVKRGGRKSVMNYDVR